MTITIAIAIAIIIPATKKSQSSLKEEIGLKP
jgi:hypothetical protein